MSFKITDLKVADLRKQLEERGLDKSGVKSALVERLRNALQEEGIDADEHYFEDGYCKTGTARSKICEDDEMITPENRNEAEGTPISSEELNDNKPQEERGITQIKTTSHISEDSSKDVEECSSTVASTEISKDKISKTDANNESQSTNANADTNDNREEKNRVPKVISKGRFQLISTTATTLWVNGLTSTSKVLDLKNLFCKYGKVRSVKIVRSNKNTRIKWIGLVTMATSQESLKCIEKLHHTKFGGHVISVERRQAASIVKKSEATIVGKTIKKNAIDFASVKSDKALKSSENDKHEKSQADRAVKFKNDPNRSSPERGHRGYDRSFFSRGRSSSRRPFGTFRNRDMSFRVRGPFSDNRRPHRLSPYDRPGFHMSSRGRNEFDYERSPGNRDCILEREMRMMQNEEIIHHNIMQKQNEEAYLLQLEKNELRLEREMLEYEKAKLLKLERAKQRREREQIVLEREKLYYQSQISNSGKKYFREGFPSERRDFIYKDLSSFHREKFSGEGKFPYSGENSTYKKVEFMHEEFRRKKMEAPSYSRFVEHREVNCHSDPEPKVYSRSEFRGYRLSSSPPLKHSCHIVEHREVKYRSSPPLKHSCRRSDDKLSYAPRNRKMDYY